MKSKLNIFSRKENIFVSIAILILIVFVSSSAFAMENIFSKTNDKENCKEDRAVLEGFDTSSTQENKRDKEKYYLLSDRDCEDLLSGVSGNDVERKLQKIRENLLSNNDADIDEPLIDKNNNVQNIGIPLVFNDAVEHYIRYFTTTKKDLFKRWIKRKKHYAPLVKEVLRENGLPEDLVYLAMIESGFNLQAYSPMKAAGPWQFIPQTGKRYGLEVNHWVDERRDIRKSTLAAAHYLKDLFDQFGCWYLAAAGYNAGENRIDRLIRKHGTKDFWELRAYNTLPRETREYVPQLIAAAIIAKNPEKYGLGRIEDVPAFEFVKETIPGGVPLKVVARAALVDVPSIKTLNPEIRRGITPPGKDYRIKLPVETDIDNFKLSLTSVLNEEKRVVKVIRHLTKRQDNIGKIAKKYGVSKEDIVLVNGSPLRLKSGVPVYIPKFNKSEGGEEILAKKAEFRQKTVNVNKRSITDVQRTTTHVVRKGDSLSAIAAKYGVEVSTLKRINRLKSDHIKKGKKLVLASYVKKTTIASKIKYHYVRKGDTLSLIARKYGKSIRAIRSMNKLKGDNIKEGMKLRVSSSSIVSVQDVT